MPTIVTHGFVATLLGKSVAVGCMPARFWILSVLCPVLPDADVLGFPLGIRYEDMLGHRGLSHSLVFAFVLSWIVAFGAFPRLPESWTRFLLFSYFFVVTASHGALDAMTDADSQPGTPGRGECFCPAASPRPVCLPKRRIHRLAQLGFTRSSMTASAWWRGSDAS
jgi:membrane-bound metal-dependent hydrolase YbcI (DUF457 family)